MSPIKALLPVFTALFLSAGALAANTPAPQPAGGPGMGMAGGSCRGIMRNLTPEEHMMHFQEMHPANMGSMTVDQYRAWHKAKCDKFRAMTPAEMQKYAVDLQAKWDALPDSEKVKLYQQMKRFHSGKRGRGMGAGRGQGRGWR